MTRDIPRGGRAQGRLLEVTVPHQGPLFEQCSLPDGGLALGSDGHYVTVLIDVLPPGSSAGAPG